MEAKGKARKAEPGDGQGKEAKRMRVTHVSVRL